MPEREGALAEEQIVRSIQSRDVRISVNTDTPIITCQSCDPVQIATRVCGPCDVFVFAVIPFLLTQFSHENDTVQIESTFFVHLFCVTIYWVPGVQVAGSRKLHLKGRPGARKHRSG